ncbi:MAG: hypothetical protein V4563_14045 [Pseudomonadota bacterium]
MRLPIGWTTAIMEPMTLAASHRPRRADQGQDYGHTSKAKRDYEPAED